MKIKEIIKNNIKLYTIMAIIIILGTIGITYALRIDNFNAISVNTTASSLDANITYDDGYSANITSAGNILPINDNLITGPNVTDTRVLKVKFKVSGVSSNPENTIFDISLYASNIDCELRTEDLKWRLYRSDTQISEGNLSPTFDTMANNRLVLTQTQEDLNVDAQDYTFLLWISEACTGDITNCDSSLDQTKYLDKSLSGTIKLELSTGTKNTLKRVTGSALSCDYTEVNVPLCNNLTYNGSEQTLVNTSSSTLVSSQNSSYKVLPLGTTLIENSSLYTANNNVGVNAGSYPIILTLKDGYKWIDGSTEDKCIYCSIKKKMLTIETLNQTIEYGTDISNTSSNYNTSSLITGQTLSSISLNGNIVDVGTGVISSSNAKIVDDTGADVTSNYDIKYQNTGKLTINCIKSAVMPTSSDKEYTGSIQTGITGGNNVTISGTINATHSGRYSVIVTPQKNYCWSDGTNTSKTLYWNIKNPYTISYNANGGTDAPTSQTKLYGTNITLSDDIPTRIGYVFIGWNTSSNATSASYQAGDSYTSNADVTLYAVWGHNIYFNNSTIPRETIAVGGTKTIILGGDGSFTYYDVTSVEGATAEITENEGLFLESGDLYDLQTTIVLSNPTDDVRIYFTSEQP